VAEFNQDNETLIEQLDAYPYPISHQFNYHSYFQIIMV